MPCYKQRLRRINKRDMKLHLGILILCLPIAAAIQFVTEKGASIVEEEIESAIIAKAEKTLGKKLGLANVERVKEAYHSKKVTSKYLQEAKKTYGKEIDAATVEILKKAYSAQAASARQQQLHRSKKIQDINLSFVTMIDFISCRTITNIAISERHFVRTFIVVSGCDKN